MAIYSTILSNSFASRLVRYIKEVVAATGFPKTETATLMAAAAKNTAAAYKMVPNITEDIIKACELAVKKGYVYAEGIVWLSAVGFGGLAIMCACLLRAQTQLERQVQRL